MLPQQPSDFHPFSYPVSWVYVATITWGCKPDVWWLLLEFITFIKLWEHFN
jgi:hypothetical protein